MEYERYNIVFRYTKEAGGYEGVMFWTSFKNDIDFKKWYTPDIEKMQKIVAQGVTSEKAIELCRETPLTCRIAAAFQEATDLETGEINQEILVMELTNIPLDILTKR